MNGTGFLCACAMSATMLAAGVSEAKRVQIDLTANGGGGARGRASVAARGSKGHFEVKVRGLEASADYDLVVGGIKVAAIHTSGRGAGTARFSTRPRGVKLMLGFDPRGEAIEVRDLSGFDVLNGVVPLGSDDAPDGICCIPDDSGAECEDRSERSSGDCRARAPDR